MPADPGQASVATPRAGAFLPVAGLAALLGLWLTLDGLWARLFGAYLFPDNSLSYWKVILEPAGLGPAAMGWPLVVLGSSWAGALIGLSMGRRWGYRACWILAGLAFPLAGAPSLLAAGVMAGLLSPALRRLARTAPPHA